MLTKYRVVSEITRKSNGSWMYLRLNSKLQQQGQTGVKGHC
ncbi:hypothetical protein Hanom_Chr16g01454331 [Helianthus anomalus]